LGELVYGLLAPESRKVLQRCAVDLGGVLEPKKPWALFSYSILTLYVSGCVGLDQPPLVGPSGVFFMEKKVGSRG